MDMMGYSSLVGKYIRLEITNPNGAGADAVEGMEGLINVVVMGRDSVTLMSDCGNGWKLKAEDEHRMNLYVFTDEETAMSFYRWGGGGKRE